MTPFERAESFATNLNTGLALYEALIKIEELKEEVGEDSPEYKLAEQILLFTIEATYLDEMPDA
tara:strand:+ start:8 stop:199 length:192 start_codon:yes stop_codon:yes gene_type:complete